MRRLLFVHPFVFCILSASLWASDLRQELRQATESMSPENCVANMGKIAGLLDAVSVEDYVSEINATGHEPLLDELFGFKITIHDKLRQFHQAKGIEKACSDATRHALRAIRTSEDYVSEHFYRTYKDTIEFPDNSFGEENIHVRRNPEFSDFNLMKDLRSGDVLLTRGNAYTSAAIASLGEFDTQFSHMSIVYRKENGELWTVEAHIEVGSFVRPLQEHIEDKNYRTMVFRFDDAKVAHKAAEFIFNKAKQASDTTGNILYDFGFNQDHNEKLFCSEVVSHAYDVASNGAVKLPLFRSRLMARKPSLVKMLEIEAEESFIPADIEVDPRFKIVSEWRDASRTQENLQKDAVIHAMFRWNDKLGYQMIQGASKKSFLYRNVAWPLRRVPYLKKYFVDKLPLNMSRKLIGYFGVLDSIGEFLQERLIKADDQAIAERGVPLLKSEKYAVLEGIRIADLQARRKKLHKMYRPVTKD